MRVRPLLLFWGILNGWLGISLVLAAGRQHRTLQVAIDIGYGVAFLIAALACLIGVALWSEWMQRRIAAKYICRTRVVAQTISFMVMVALAMIEVVALFFLGGTLLAVGFVVGLVFMQASALTDGDLTPIREAIIWQQQRTGAGIRWMPQWLRLSRH